MAERTTIETVDYHTAGEPFRIVVDPPVALPGSTVAERRALAIDSREAQLLRQTLCYEPRGHADMYGGFLTPPDDEGAHFGVLFWHKDGFSTACGHGTIALGVWAVDSGLVAAPDDGSVDVVIDVPSGRVTARVHRQAGRTTAVDFVNVPGYVLRRDIEVSTSRGAVTATLVYSGAIYATLEARQVGLTVVPESVQDLIAIGREIKWALNDHPAARHPSDERLNGVYGTILVDDLGRDGEELHQRNITVFADGEVDRSPCGSGTCGRVVELADAGLLTAGMRLRHDSIVGSSFTAIVLDVESVAGRHQVRPQVTGMAYPTGQHRFIVDPHDPLVPGFVLR